MSRDEARMVRRELVDVPRVLRWLGLDKRAKRQPRGYVVCCPVHGEKNPSCSVRLAQDGTISAKCFACDFSGDVFALIAAARGLDARTDFRAVLSEAAELAGVRLDDPTPLPARRAPPPRPAAPPEPAALTADEFAALADDLLRVCPLDAPDAEPVRAYLRGRYLVEAACVAMWGALPPASRQRAVIGELADRHGASVLERSGLIRVDESGPRFDRFAWPQHRLVIPWFGSGDSAPVHSLQRRRLDAGEPKYVFPSGRRPEIPYGLDQYHGGPSVPVVYVEGAFDVLATRTLYAAEDVDRTVLGIPGVANWKPEWALFAKGREAIIGVDWDRAGEALVDRMMVDLVKAGATKVRRAQTVREKDWGDEVVKRGRREGAS